MPPRQSPVGCPRPHAAAAPAPAPAPHVCMLCPGSAEGAGGIGRFVANLAAEIRRIDPAAEIEVVNTRGDGHIALAPLFFAGALARIARAAASRRRPVVLHVNVASRGSALRKYLVVRLAAALGVPVILHLHGAAFESFHAGLPPVLRRRVRAMFARAERVVVLGSTWKRFVARTLGVPEARILIVPNGVPAPPPHARATLNAAEPHIVFLGRLGARKGVPELIAALGSTALRDLPWRATLAGDGDPRPFKAEATRLGIAARLHFPGWLEQEASAGLLHAATLLVLPSRAEGLPMAVIEALAHGVPVVTTPVGAIPDFLTDDDSALLVPPGDAAALAQALVRLVGSPELRQRLARRGHEVFARHFDIAEIARRFTALYAELDAQRVRAARPSPHPS